MTNTQKFYNLMKRHAKFLSELSQDYHQQLEAIEPYRGSEAFDWKLEALEESKARRLETQRQLAQGELDEILSDMVNTWDNRALAAPSSEMVNTLNTMRAMKNIPSDMFKQAANSMGGCPLALEALSQIASDHGQVLAVPGQMSGARVKESIGQLRRGAGHFISAAHDTGDSTRHELLNDPNSSDAILWRMTGPEATASMENALRIFGNITDSASFCAAVDGGTE